MVAQSKKDSTEPAEPADTDLDGKGKDLDGTTMLSNSEVEPKDKEEEAPHEREDPERDQADLSEVPDPGLGSGHDGGDDPGFLTVLDVTSCDMVPLEKMNSFYDLDLAEGSGFLHHSSHATELGLWVDAFTAEGLQVLESKLQAVVWTAFKHFGQSGTSHVLLNLRGNAKEKVQVKRPVPDDLKLPFAGLITQQPPRDSSTTRSLKFCWVFGLDFYISAMPADVLAHSVAVPAWCVKGVNKADQAYFDQDKCTFKVIMSADPKLGERASLLDLNLAFVPSFTGSVWRSVAQEDIDAVIHKKFQGLKTCA